MGIAVAVVVEEPGSHRRRRATDSELASRRRVGEGRFRERKREDGKEKDIVDDWDLRGPHQAPRPGRSTDTSDYPPWCFITRRAAEGGIRILYNQHWTISRRTLELSEK